MSAEKCTFARKFFDTRYDPRSAVWLSGLWIVFDSIMLPPLIETSTQEERRAYVREKWECMHNCELCGKCHILRGRDAETLYTDYIEGRRSYMDITLEIRK